VAGVPCRNFKRMDNDSKRIASRPGSPQPGNQHEPKTGADGPVVGQPWGLNRHQLHSSRSIPVSVIQALTAPPALYNPNQWIECTRSSDGVWSIPKLRACLLGLFIPRPRARYPELGDWVALDSLSPIAREGLLLASLLSAVLLAVVIGLVIRTLNLPKCRKFSQRTPVKISRDVGCSGSLFFASSISLREVPAAVLLFWLSPHAPYRGARGAS
jgi:hypothetical protein